MKNVLFKMCIIIISLKAEQLTIKVIIYESLYNLYCVFSYCSVVDELMQPELNNRKCQVIVLEHLVAIETKLA